jgi:hypothetical protein
VKIPTAIVHTAADVHDVLSSTTLNDSVWGTAFPIFFADNYIRNGSINGYSRYDGGKNGMSLWYCTTEKRWAMTPVASAGVCADIANYPHTQKGTALTSISNAAAAVVTVTGANNPSAAGTAFTVAIQGASFAGVNGTFTATAINATSFSIPVNTTASGAIAVTSATCTVLNQTFLQGLLSSASVAAPVQCVTATVTCNGHGYGDGAGGNNADPNIKDYVHFYGAQGTHATSANDLFTSAAVNSMTSAINVTDANTFTFTRYASTQPKIGTAHPSAGNFIITVYPHMRRTTSADAAIYAAQQLRARGVCVSLIGMNGV